MKKEAILVCIIFIFISLFFFNPLLKGHIPFPGDLLVGEYSPYNSYPFLGFAPGGFPNKGQDFDVLRLLYPAKEFSIKSLKNFEWPLWNPYNFSGNPHLASVQSGTFYPFNIVFWFFPFDIAWSIYIIIQPILSALFLYLLLRSLSLNIKSAIFGGIIFAFSSYQTVWMEYGNIGHSVLWLPFAMWLSLKIINKFSLLLLIILILSLASSFLAGYVQTTFYVFIFLFIFITFEIFNKHKNQFFNKLIIFLPVFVFPFLLSAFQLLPTVELFSNSARSSYSLSEFIKLLIPNIHLTTLLVPDFFGNPATRNYWLNGTYIERVSYVGIIPLLLALYGVIKKPVKPMLFFIISIIFIYLITFDSIFSRTLYALFLPPIISTAVPTRIMFLLCFSLSILAAYGFNCIQIEKIDKKSWLPSVVLGIILVFLWIFVFSAQYLFRDQPWIQYLNISKRNLVIPTIFLFTGAICLYLLITLKKLKNYIFAALLLLTIFDFFLFFQKITPFSPRESLYPNIEVLEYLRKIQGINRSWGYGSAYIDANIQTHEGIFSTNGYDALHLKRYGELLTASKDGKISKSIPGSNADIVQGYGENDLVNNYSRQKILNLLGVKYVLHKISPDIKHLFPDVKIFSENNYKLIWQESPWQIYENKGVLPRFFLVGNYIVEKDNQKIINKLLSKNFNLRKTLILEDEISNFDFKEDQNAEVSLVSYASNKIVFKTQSEKDNLLFVSDNYYPGWDVLIDGVKGNIYRADYSFRAVAIKKGQHEIIFKYYPASFDLGIKISLIAFFSIIIYAIMIKIMNNKQNVQK
ncbi:MAG: YfhO family protein [Actinobacteria bacterium]|nr:YfhO family protein [Actinomycetota bacterium]